MRLSTGKKSVRKRRETMSVGGDKNGSMKKEKASEGREQVHVCFCSKVIGGSRPNLTKTATKRVRREFLGRCSKNGQSVTKGWNSR